MPLLTNHEISLLCKKDPPLIRNYFNWDEQLQPSGFDLTIDTLFSLRGSGKICTGTSGHEAPEEIEVNQDPEGFFSLSKGYYIVLLNEIVSLPKNICGINHPRSTLMRYGGIMTTGIWDAGFHGRSRVGLYVVREEGLKLQKNAMIMQMSFHELTGESMGFQYNALYEKELTETVL